MVKDWKANICDINPDAEGCDTEDWGDIFDDPDNPYGESDSETDPMNDDTDCNPEMRVRKIIPDNNVIAPINTQPIVLTIGNGDDSHLSVEVLTIDLEVVPSSYEVECYPHESDTETHCTYLLTMEEELQPFTDYIIEVKGTEFHQDSAMVYQSWFSTNGSRLNLERDTAPDSTILAYTEREESAVTFCDWKDAMKYEVAAKVQEEQSTNLSIVQVYESMNRNLDDETLMHSIILPSDFDAVQFRQVMSPGTEGNRCYRVAHRIISGDQSQLSSVICWE